MSRLIRPIFRPVSLEVRRLCAVLLAFFLLASWVSPAVGQSAENDFETVRASAEAAHGRGDVQESIRLYTQAVALKPEWPDGWWFLGTTDYGIDKYPEAREALTHFIALTPDAGPALALRGLCEFEIGDYSQSLQDLEQGISLGAASQPRNAPIVLYHEALVLTRLGQFDAAIGKYQYFVKHTKPSAELMTGVGLAGLRMSLLPRDVEPADAELVSMVGQAAVAVMNGDESAGREKFQQVFERFPSLPNLHYLYGYLLFAIDPPQAIVQFQQELAVDPQSALAHAMLAWADGLQGDYAKALPNAEKAAEEDPGLPMGQLVCGRDRIETGDLAGGVPYLENVTKMEPGNLEAHITLVKAYSKLGRNEDARRERLICLAISQQGANPSATP